MSPPADQKEKCFAISAKDLERNLTNAQALFLLSALRQKHHVDGMLRHAGLACRPLESTSLQSDLKSAVVRLQEEA